MNTDPATSTIHESTPTQPAGHGVDSAARAAIPRVLSIAGTDPTGGAGIHADLKSIAANGGYGMAVVTSLVAQNTRGVRSIHTPPVEFLREQLDAVSDDVIIDAVKIGMLFDVATIEAVRSWLERVRPPLVVLDPVMVAASGDRLLSADAEAAMRGLLGVVDLATPNMAELAVLAEEPAATDWAGVLRQARLVSSRHRLLVLAKGGHLESDSAPDALVDDAADEQVVEFPGERIATGNTHGTGCSLSSAVATWRARTGSWVEAVGRAKAWLTESIRHADELHVGSGYGPVSHVAGLWQRGGIETPPTPAQVASEWWTAIEDTRAAIDTCAFARGLGEGTLDPAAFGWYLTQDAIYLRGYARALTAAGTLAPTPDEQAFWADAAHQTIVTELQLHEGRLGPAADLDAEPGPVTARYLAHLLAPVAVGDYPTLVAGVLPCFWLYQDAGTRVREQARPGHPYADWLATYDDPAFAEATRRAIEIVTATAARGDERTRDTMRTAFVTAAGLELAFFEAPMEPTRG